MKNRIFLISTLILVFPFTSLFARNLAILVEDADLQIPLEGAEIHSSDGNITICDEDGKARLNLLDEHSDYILITYPGYDNYRFVIPSEGLFFVVNLHLLHPLENKELVFIGTNPDEEGASLGRNFALNKKQVDIVSRIGLVEDVMNVVKLLPGVGYAGFFNAQPSLRGGEPGDLTAVFDGFYISNPYHWGGAYSIFNPHMVERVTLSHGVFSARYGHTISGILEVISKKASNQYTQAEVSVSTSALDISLSMPLGFNTLNPSLGGALSIMGKASYWDGYVAFIQALSNTVPFLQVMNSVKQAPYIRSGSLQAHYRWNSYLEAKINSYVGNDGVELEYQNHDSTANLLGNSDGDLRFFWDNTTAFISAAAIYNPAADMAIKGTFGVGMNNTVYETYTKDILKINTNLLTITTKDNYTNRTNSAQGRVEFDWGLNQTCLLSFGSEEVFKQWIMEYDNNLKTEKEISPGNYAQKDIYTPGSRNNALFSSGWSILEYNSLNKKYRIEFGLRADQIYFMGEDFSVNSVPAINPRLDLDYMVFSDKKYIDRLTLSFGSGLFSALNQTITTMNKQNGLKELMQTRSWTSLLGLKLDFIRGWNLNFEMYYKYVFDRAYYRIEEIDTSVGLVYFFNGTAHIYGFDLMLQKVETSTINGWLSYSFNYARYYDPDGNRAFFGADFPGGFDRWYYPEFHRFHTINLVANYPLSRRFNIYVRTGFVSGMPDIDHDIQSYNMVLPNGNGPVFKITKYRDNSTYSDTKRKIFTIPLDIKLSYYFFYKNGKTQGELYFAIENALVLVLPKDDNFVLNPYTGKTQEGAGTALYQLPIPMISFGIRWSY
ncbi:MAG: TonB-dependent receptor plug domain-containing protein [Spirochaetaceae bacterium]|nr:TonB-dependent receptor plug domain-containing protein [Spirochaetaceae bacterium]